MPWLFLIVSIVGAAFTYNALRPSYSPPRRAVLSFLAGWLTTELALHHVAWQAVLTAGFAWAGALQRWPGVLGLAITVISWIGLGHAWWTARRARIVVERALCEGLGADYADGTFALLDTPSPRGGAWRPIILPLPIRPRNVERIRNIIYARAAGIDLKLDVYRHRSHPTNRPTLVQIHGGAWTIGNKNQQGLPLMLHLAARGWVCISVNYRLSPHATFPDHLIDLKRALKWVREHGPEYGADRDFMAVTGGSAGGHLAALLALTANDPEYQPGFEEVDTTVRGCVSFYGVYDLTNRYRLHRHDGLAKLLERRVMKAALREASNEYEKASPISRLSPTAPPFFIIHGDRDTLVPVEEARRFAEEFRRRAHGRMAYAELPGAQHAFDIFPSLRCVLVVEGVERFLTHLYGKYLAARPFAIPAVDD